MGTIKNGDVYTKWTVITAYPDYEVGKDHQKSLCRCSCGTKKMIRRSSLRCGISKSCQSCSKKIHGMRNTRVYNSWSGMKSRCLNKKHTFFYRYGGRGITICKRWLKFENFYKDMGNPPTNNHSLDRINNDGNYEPSNCHWATIKQQANNTRRNRMITFNNETRNIKQWAEYLGINYKSLYTRLNQLGWSINRAFNKK